MGNIKPPKDVKVSARITSATKRKVDKCKYSYGELIDIGVRHVSSDLNLLKLEREELLDEVADAKHELKYKEMRLKKIESDIAKISPSDVSPSVDLVDVVGAAKNYADVVYEAHGDLSLELVMSKEIYQKSIKREARDNGYLPSLFLDEVIKNLEILCHTCMSDNSAGIY